MPYGIGKALTHKKTIPFTVKRLSPALRSWGRLLVVLKNPGFSFLLAIFSMVPMAMMSYVAASSYIYISGFGLSEQKFSFFFALNALSAMAGPTLYIKISKHISTHSIVSGCFALLMCCGIIVVTVGNLSPVLFAMTLAPATIALVP